jgi:PHD/YefM family antitoxin component YafN of YafNO toxin-antitoxin module
VGRKTYKSEEARLKLRDILDEVMTGAGDVVIERYSKPTVVVEHSMRLIEIE